jgi:putative acid phosphatase of HAD superfamily subfamily IIIB
LPRQRFRLSLRNWALRAINRPPALSLREQGYEWTGLILLPDVAQFASAGDFKAPERRKITEQGYTIILNVGDQESTRSFLCSSR